MVLPSGEMVRGETNCVLPPKKSVSGLGSAMYLYSLSSCFSHNAGIVLYGLLAFPLPIKYPVMYFPSPVHCAHVPSFHSPSGHGSASQPISPSL